MRESDKKPLSTINDPRWQKITARDKIADGQFWYSVITTGTYCRPSCPSRPPNQAM
nr:Ada metal-binding domain-containing protein [Acetobacter indonesiensis]